MTSTAKFYDSIDTQIQFLDQLHNIPLDVISDIADFFRKFIFQENAKQKVVYGIGEGRSALSLYDFLQQLLKFANIFPVTLDDPIRRYFEPDKINMIIAASGSGTTESVINYLDDAYRMGAREILITAKSNTLAHQKINAHKGYVIMLEDVKLDKPGELAVMGSEFELKLCSFLNCLLPVLDNGNCQLYYRQVKHFINNAAQLKDIDSNYLQPWIDRLLNRRGNFIVDGVGRSGFVARAFGMRLTHMGLHVYVKGDATTPSFLRGDVYIPVSGSGDTREILEVMKRARDKGADIFPITVNQNSKLVEYMTEWGYRDNIIFIPVETEDLGIFHDRTPSKISTTKRNQMRPSYSEINSYIFTNAVIAAAIDFLGVEEKYLKRIHW